MAEILQRGGAWTFDGETVRIVPGNDRHVPALRKSLGEVAVPLRALAGIAYEPGGRKGGRLRLRLREGADPLWHVANGRLPDASDPYQLAVERDRTGVGEYFAEEVRNALLLEGVPDTPCDRYLLPGPSVPQTALGTDGTATFDGERIQIDWNWMAEKGKSSGGPRHIPLHEVAGVDWTPAVVWDNGNLRFRLKGTHPTLKPEHDPNCLMLWGVRPSKETGGSVLLAAAVVARLPHPLAASAGAGAAGRTEAEGEAGPAAPPASTALPAPSAAGSARPAAGMRPSAAGGAEAADHDVLLRRLRELGELRESGVLTEDEFSVAKKAILDRF